MKVADIPNSIIDGKVFIDMGLSSSGDNFAAIYDPEKVEIDISDDFNGLEDDKSFGRTTDAGSEWATLAYKTPGAPNDGDVTQWQENLLSMNLCVATIFRCAWR